MDTALGNMFVRITGHPEQDLHRGYSYSMGCFGDEAEAHAGLSTYSVRKYGLRDAIETLDRRMGISGGDDYFVLLAGSDVGSGPDGDDLCRPARILFSRSCSDIDSVDHLIELLAAAGIVDA